MRHHTATILTWIVSVLVTIQVLPADTDSANRALAVRLRSVLPGLTSAERRELLEEGTLTAGYGLEPGSEISTRLSPAFRDPIANDLREMAPKLGAEVLFLVDAPAGAGELSPRLFRELQAISTMEGIDYYSASRDRMRILFHESYVIDDPESRNRIRDPRPARVPARDELYVFQRDSSFGSNVLELSYTANQESVRVRMRNLTQMYYMGFIPAVGPHELMLNLVVHPMGEKLLFYGNSAANPISLLGMEARVRRSFTNRLVALYEWFLTRF